MDERLVELLSTEQYCPAKHKFITPILDPDGRILVTGMLFKQFKDRARPQSLIDSIQTQLRAQGVVMIVRDSIAAKSSGEKNTSKKQKKSPFLHFICHARSTTSLEEGSPVCLLSAVTVLVF